MKIKWILLLITAVITLNLGSVADRLRSSPPIRFQTDQLRQEATPQPAFDDVEAPRPPSEAGQNMVLIMGAAMLVLIVFFGVALNARRPHQNSTPEH